MIFQENIEFSTSIDPGIVQSRLCHDLSFMKGRASAYAEDHGEFEVLNLDIFLIYFSKSHTKCRCKQSNLTLCVNNKYPRWG